MTKRTVGIDIGTTAVRAAVVSKVDSEGFAVVERFGLAATRPDAFTGGRIRNPQAISIAILQALKAAGVPPEGIGAPRIVVGTASPEISIGRFQLPAALRRKDRVRAIRAQAVQVAPSIPLSEAALSTDFVRFEQTADGRQVATVTVAAAVQEEIDRILAVCHLAGVEPRAIDLSAAGTFRALVRDSEASKDISTIVDVGASQTMVTTRQGAFLRSVRCFPQGGADLTRAVAQAARIDFAAAEERKCRMRLPSSSSGTKTGTTVVPAGYGDPDLNPDEFQAASVDATAVEQALAISADQLIDTIAQTVELDAAQFHAMTAQITVCGGSALLRGLKERLQRRCNVEVRVGAPWARLARNSDNEPYFINDREDPRVMLSLATAAGLALWEPQR